MRKFYIENNETLPAVAFEDVAPVGFTEITDQEELKRLYAFKYKERMKDGGEYYNDLRSQLYLDIVNGTITEQQAFDLEVHIKTVSDNLLTGNWLTAQNANINLPLLGIYDQAMKDGIHNDLDNYINFNY